MKKTTVQKIRAILLKSGHYNRPSRNRRTLGATIVEAEGTGVRVYPSSGLFVLAAALQPKMMAAVKAAGFDCFGRRHDSNHSFYVV